MNRNTFKTAITTLGLGYLLYGLAACNPGSSTTMATPTPTPAPTPAPGLTPAPTPEPGALAEYVQLLTYIPAS